MRYRLANLFWLTTFIAAFFGLRAFYIYCEDDDLAGVIPLILGSAVAIFLAAKGNHPTVSILACAAAAFLSIGFIAFEVVFHSEATAFVWDVPHPPRDYVDDGVLNALAVLVITIVSTAVGCAVLIVYHLPQRVRSLLTRKSPDTNET